MFCGYLCLLHIVNSNLLEVDRAIRDCLYGRVICVCLFPGTTNKQSQHVGIFTIKVRIIWHGNEYLLVCLSKTCAFCLLDSALFDLIVTFQHILFTTFRDATDNNYDIADCLFWSVGPLFERLCLFVSQILHQTSRFGFHSDCHNISE